MTHLTTEEITLAFDEVAATVLDKARWFEPPVDALEIARRLGIDVARDDRQTGRARYARLALPGHDRHDDPHAAIFLRSDPRRERVQWAVAHELGEHVSPLLFARLNLAPHETSPGMREHLANQFAGQLLLPTDWFQQAGEATAWDLLELKATFATASHELIARRMLELGPSAVMTVVDQGAITWRRASDGRGGRTWFPGEQECWQQTHQQNQTLARATDVGRVHAWPLHEADWKREIVRFEPTGWEEA